MAKLDLSTIDWRAILIGEGIDETLLTKQGSACPICGGRDRFYYDEKKGPGTWFSPELRLW